MTKSPSQLGWPVRKTAFVAFSHNLQVCSGLLPSNCSLPLQSWEGPANSVHFGFSNLVSLLLSLWVLWACIISRRESFHLEVVIIQQWALQFQWLWSNMTLSLLATSVTLAIPTWLMCLWETQGSGGRRWAVGEVRLLGPLPHPSTPSEIGGKQRVLGKVEDRSHQVA